MSNFTIGHRLPYFLASRLFGDRKQHGLIPRYDDPCWREWERRYLDFYYANQKASIGAVVNNMGYRILRKVDLSSASVLEVGPGDILHMDQWQGVPKRFVIADVQQAMLDRSAARLVERKVCFETKLMARTDITSLPFNTAEFDYILSFYSLEHLYPLESTLAEFARVLRPGGKLVGSIPAEGGLAWGMGRFLTTRRWLKKHTTIDPDKIICWEHPNFADHILRLLDRFFVRQRVTYRPFCIPSIDLNLVISFIFERK